MSNEPATRIGRQIVDEFERHVKRIIDNKGVYPLPMMVATARGIDVAELRCKDSQALEIFCKAASHREVTAAMLGLDRYGSSEQGVAMEDILTCVLYERPVVTLELPRARDQFKFGVIAYHYKPRVVCHADWNNVFWILEMRQELYRCIPDCVFGDTPLVKPVH